MSGLTIIIITIAVVTIPFLWFIYKITFTDFLYEPEKGTRKKGINLTSLHALPGDKINHIGFKLFAGLNLLILVIIMDWSLIWLYDKVAVDFITEQEVIDTVVKYTILLSIGLLIPIILLYSSIKERFIERVSSVPPRSHKIAVRICIFIFIALVICLLPFL